MREFAGHPDARHRRRGFSLIELMLVMAIMAVLAAMAMPRYGAALSRYRADSAAKRVAADIAFAQSRARSASTSRSVVFNVSGGSYQIPGEADLIRPSQTYSVSLSSAPYIASIATVSFGSSNSSTLTFNGFGMPNNAGYVKVTSGSITRKVSIDADGGNIVVQ